MKKNIKFKRLIVIGILIYVIYTLFVQQKTLNAYKNEEKYYNEELSKTKEKNQDLINLKSNLNSTEYITDVAREKLGMYLPNERVYIDVSK
ncbi:MAG TPA: septum formation initiator family protein [Clostridia bacterium]|nr:septum formation initiator family protein [Clostridia bacterium]